MWWRAQRHPRRSAAADGDAALEKVRLEVVDDHPVPALPDLGPETSAVREHLRSRFENIPFRRVHGMSDCSALQAEEADHVERLGVRHHLDDEAVRGLGAHSLARVEREMADVSDRLRFRHSDLSLNSRIARRLRGRNFLFQVWFNTVGPGARCWIGNRYAPVRRHTIRLRWRP